MTTENEDAPGRVKALGAPNSTTNNAEDSSTLPSGRSPIIIIRMLAMRFPDVFSVWERRRQPLKVGIRDDLIEVVGNEINLTELVRALRHYTCSKGYLIGIAQGRPRVDLYGRAVGVVSFEQERRARGQLLQLAEHLQLIKKEKLAERRRLAVEELKATGRKRRAGGAS
jgi:sRNA-binding protein